MIPSKIPYAKLLPAHKKLIRGLPDQTAQNCKRRKGPYGRQLSGESANLQANEEPRPHHDFTG